MNVSSPQRICAGSWRTNGPAAAVFAQLAGRVTGTEAPAVFTVLGRGRRTFWGWLGFAATLMPAGSLPRADSELVILRVGARRNSRYEISHHRRIARRAGLSTAQIEAIIAAAPDAAPSGSTVSAPTAAFDERQRLLLAATDELLATDDLGDALWQDLHARLGDRGCVEFLLLVGHYRMLATTFTTLRMPPDTAR